MATGNKEILLKKRLIKDSIIAVVLLVILAVGALELSHYDDDTQSEKEMKTKENATLQADLSALQQQFSSGTQATTWYTQYAQGHNTEFALNREAATGWLSDLREKYHLANLSVTISPISDVTTENFQLKTGKMVKSDVKLTFVTISDSNVYNFIEGLQKQFPGIVLVYDLKITEGPDFPKDVTSDETHSLQQNMLKAFGQNLAIDLSKHIISPMVNVELSFLWLGIRHEDKPEQPQMMRGGPGIGR